MTDRSRWKMKVVSGGAGVIGKNARETQLTNPNRIFFARLRHRAVILNTRRISDLLFPTPPSFMLKLASLLFAIGALLLAASRLHAEGALPPMPQPATSFGATIADSWLYTYGGN